MSSRTQRPPTTTTSTATASARRESRIYDPHSAYYTDSQHHPPSSSRKTAKPTKSRDHHPPPAASSYYYSKNGYHSSYELPTTAAAGIARPQSVAPSISSHRDYPTVPPARAPSAQPSLHHYSSHAQLPPARPPSTQPQQIARPPSRAAHGVAPSVSQSQTQSQAWAAYYAAGGTVPSTLYGAPSTSAAGSQAPPPASSSRAPPASASTYPSLFEGYANGIDDYAASSQNPASSSYGHPYQNLTIPGKARSSRHRDLEKEYDPSPQSSNERVVWQQQAATTADDQREGRPGPPPSAPVPIPGVAGTARSTRHRERERDQPSTSYKQQGSYEPQAYGPSSSYVIPPQGIAVAKSTRSVRERDAVPAGVAVAASTTRRRDKERERERDRGDRTDAEDERREERRRNRDRERDRGGYRTDVEDERRREERRRDRDRDREDKTDAEDDKRREERRRDRERSTRDRERERETDAEDAYRRRKEREREERRRERDRGDKDRERGAYTDAEDEAAAIRRREERRREREEEKRREEEKKRERERERQEREREDERRREERERIRQERIRIETEERERRRRIQAEADYRAQSEAQAASRAQAEVEEREKQRRVQAEARARAEAEERERQRRLEQAEAEERERQRLALVEQERRAARAEAEERQRRLQAEAEERHRKMQAEATAAQAREAEEQRRLQAEAQARAQAEAEARSRAESEAQAAHAREQERQRQLQAEADEKERHRLAFLEQQRQAAAAKAEAEEKQRRLQAEAAARAKAEAQERERQERERQRRLQAQAEAEEKERERQAAALAKAEAEARQKRRQEEAEERERQRRIQAEAQARAEAEERQRRLQAEAQAKAEAEEKERQRQDQARAEAEERERHRLAVLEHERRVAEEHQRRLQAEAEEQERQRQYQQKAAAEAQEKEYHRRLQAEAEEKERQRRRQAEAEERERQRRHQADLEERERQRRHQAEAEERERERQRRHQAEAEERDRQRRLQAEAEEKERHRLIFMEQQRQAAIAKAEAEERQRRLQEEAEARERERVRQAAEDRQRKLQAESEEREQQRLRAEAQARAEAEERERQRRLRAEADESERQRVLAEEWTRKEKERLTANTKGSNDILWGPPVPAKNSHPNLQSAQAMTVSAAEPPTSQRQASSTAVFPSPAPLRQAHPQHLASQVPQDSSPLRVLGDSNRDRGLSENSPKSKKRESQHLSSSFPVVEKTGSGRYKEKNSRQSVIPSTSTQLHATAAISNNPTQSHGGPTLAPTPTQVSTAQIHSSERDTTFVESGRERNGENDKRRTSKLPENLYALQTSYQPFVSPGHEAAAAAPSSAARLAALMTHTDSNLPYFQRKPSKDSLVVNPNTSGFLVAPVDFSQHRQPSQESIHDITNALGHSKQQALNVLATPGPVRNFPPRSQQVTQQQEHNLHQRPSYERNASAATVPVLPLHPPSILSQDVTTVEPQTNRPSRGGPHHSSGRTFGLDLKGEHGGTSEKDRESERERLMHQEGETHRFEREREQEKEPQWRLDQEREEREREAQRITEEQKQVKGKKAKKETKKEKAQAKKREKEREKEELGPRPPFAAGQAEFSAPADDDENTVANSTIKGRSGPMHKGLPDIWMPSRSSHDQQREPQQQHPHEHELLLPDPSQSTMEPASATSTVKAKKDRRHRRKVSFGQDKAGQESSSEQELPSGTWNKGSLRGLFRNPRNTTEEAQVSSTDTDQDQETAKRHKRRTSSRLQEGFSAAVEASAKLASLLVPGRGDRSRKSSNHSIMVAHEPSFDEDTAARGSQEQLPEPPSNVHQRTSSQDTNTIPFPQPTNLGKGPIVSAPITAPLGDEPEFIVPRSPYRGPASLPSAHHNERTTLAPNHPPASTNSSHEQIRTEDVQRLAALIDAGEPAPIHSRSRNVSLAPTPGQPESVPVKSYFDPAVPYSRDVHRPSTAKPSLKPKVLAGAGHPEDYDRFHGDRPTASTYVSSPVAYHDNAVVRPPTLAPPEPERPTLPASISYSSTTVEASSRSGPTLTQSGSSHSVPTISQTKSPSVPEPFVSLPLQGPSVDGYMANETTQIQGSRSRQPSVNNGDVSVITQLLARVTGSKNSHQNVTDQQPLPSETSLAPLRDVNASNILPTPSPTRNGDIEPASSIRQQLPLQATEHVLQKSSVSAPSVYSHHEASAWGSKERVHRSEPTGEQRVAARDAVPASGSAKPSLPIPVPTIPSYQTSSHHPDASRAHQPHPHFNPLPQQQAVTRTKHTSHSRQNSQDTLVDVPGSKSSPHEKPTPITGTTKGSPLANRNGSQDTIVYPASFKPSSLQDTWTAHSSSQPTVHMPNTATTSPTFVATSNATTTSSKTSDQASRPEMTSRNPNLSSEYPESRSHPIPSNTHPVSLLSATAPPNIEITPQIGPSTSHTAHTRKGAAQPDPEHSQPVASSHATRPPNSHSHASSSTHPPNVTSTQERVASIPAQAPGTTARPPHPVSSRVQDTEKTTLASASISTPAVSSRPSNSPPSRVQDTQSPAIPGSHPRFSEKPAASASRAAPQAAPPSATNQGLTSRSQEEVAHSVVLPTPLSVPPVRSTQTASVGPVADRKASGTPYPSSHPRAAPDLEAEPPAPAIKSKVERSPPTQLRQHSDPSLDVKPEPPQPTEPTTRRVKPLRGVSDQGPHRVTNAGQTVTVQLTPDGARRERVRTKDRETAKKKGLFGLFRSRESSQHPIVTPDKPMTDSNESLPESLHRLRPVESAPAAMPPLVPIATVVSRTEEKKEVDIVAPIPIHGNGKPLSKRHAPFRVTAKRYRTVSQASVDAADGNTVSMIMSGADSIRSSTAGRPSPPLRDPVLATMDWLNKEEAAHQDRGKRRRRPGVVFEVEDEQAEKQKQPAKVVRRGTRGRLTKPPPTSTSNGD